MLKLEYLGIDMKNNKNIVVYWSPFNYDNVIDWDMFYSKPEKLYSNLHQKKSKNKNLTSYFSCPAFKERSENIFLMKNTIENNIKVLDGKLINSSSDNVKISHKESIENRPIVSVYYPIIMFSEESLKVTVTPAYMHKTSYSEFGHVVMGSFDIGKWFRPINLDFMLYNKDADFSFKDEEPLYYLDFNTEKSIILKKFNMTNEILKISNACTTAPDYLKPWQSLSKRYNLFIKSGLKNKLIKEITNNIVKENE
jgi:hypothetical protein